MSKAQLKKKEKSLKDGISPQKLELSMLRESGIRNEDRKAKKWEKGRKTLTSAALNSFCWA